MATGDMKNNLRMLQTELRLMKYPESLDIPGLTQGNAKSFMPLFHYAFTSYNTHLAEEISAKDIVLFAKSDTTFMDSIYKILRDMFAYKPMVTKNQFFSSQFAERKVIMCTEVLQQIQKRCRPRPQSKPLSAFRLNNSLDNVSKPPSGRIRPKTKKDVACTDMPPPLFKPAVKLDIKKSSLNRSTSAPMYRSTTTRAAMSGQTKSRVVKEIIDPNKSCDFSLTPSILRVRPQSVEVAYMPRLQGDDGAISAGAATPNDVLSEQGRAPNPGGGISAAAFSEIGETLQTLNSTVNKLMARVEDLDNHFGQMEILFDLHKAQSSQVKVTPAVPEVQECWSNQSARLQLLENRMLILETQVQDLNPLNIPQTPGSDGKSGAFVTVETFVNGESKLCKIACEADAKILSHSAEDFEKVSPIRHVHTVDVSASNNQDEMFTMITELDPDTRLSSTPTKGDNLDLKFVDTPTHNQAERIKHLMKTTEGMLAPAPSPTIVADEADHRQHVD